MADGGLETDPGSAGGELAGGQPGVVLLWPGIFAPCANFLEVTMFWASGEREPLLTPKQQGLTLPLAITGLTKKIKDLIFSQDYSFISLPAGSI
jgi:hypothetical protein